jgi:hypothetical protein
VRRSCLLVLVLLLAACGDDDDAGTTGDTQPPAGAIDVATALQQDDGTVVTVRGHLIALPDGSAELCGGPIQESAPPQCGDPSLPVDFLEDPASLPGTTDVGGWVEGEVELRGTIRTQRLQLG